jgi:hypothetical protein
MVGVNHRVLNQCDAYHQRNAYSAKYGDVAPRTDKYCALTVGDEYDLAWT